MTTRTSLIWLTTLLVLLTSCAENNLKLRVSEKNLIRDGQGLMRVLTVNEREDSLFLRRQCLPFRDRDLRSEEFRLLAQRMVQTVTDPSQDGVGIAGPQVGLNRRVVAVQRFDKEGFPFEVYPNIRIELLGEACRPGAEGCLSVPGRRGRVNRHEQVVIRYTDPETLMHREDTVSGFTAVIFQHECDHLEGILYTDRLIPEAETNL